MPSIECISTTNVLCITVMRSNKTECDSADDLSSNVSVLRRWSVSHPLHQSAGHALLLPLRMKRTAGQWWGGISEQEDEVQDELVNSETEAADPRPSVVVWPTTADLHQSEFLPGWPSLLVVIWTWCFDHVWTWWGRVFRPETLCFFY